MQPVRATDRPLHLRRAFIVSAWRGLLRASGWPRHRNRVPSLWDLSIRNRLVELVRYTKTLLPREVVPMLEAIAHQNRTHRGFKASAAIRHRDIEVQRLSGRLFGFILPDGTVIYSFAAYQDISDTLDWLTDKPGAILTRGQCWWGGALTCTPGYPLTVRDKSDVDDCCNADYPFTCK